MAHDTLAVANTLVLGTEGGWSNHPKDPGGPTNKGVTLATLTGWWLKKNPNGPKPTLDDLRSLSDGEAFAIFDAQYATPIQYDALPDGIDYCVFDCSVNSGPSRATKLLQQALGFAPGDIDGALGSKTLGAVKSVNDVAALIARYCELRIAFMKSLKIWGTFGKGWQIRVDTVQEQALAFMRGDAPTPLVSASQIQAKATGATKILASVSGKAAVTSVAGGLVFAGGAASQLSAVLQPYGGIKTVGYVLAACAVLSSAVPLFVAIRHAASGAEAA